MLSEDIPKDPNHFRRYLTPKLKRDIVERECHSCGYTWRGFRWSHCPRCLGRLPPDRWRVVPDTCAPAGVSVHAGHGNNQSAPLTLRSWQCGTVQLDFQMPERFELEYADADGTKKRPVMIHRALFGSMERFIAIDELRRLSLRNNAILAAVPDIIMEVDTCKVGVFVVFCGCSCRVLPKRSPVLGRLNGCGGDPGRGLA